MHFFIDSDAGSAISGWLIPDNPSDIPEFIVSVPEREPFLVKANVFRSDLRDLGMHATGMAGFQIDEQHVPDLTSLKNITILEAANNIAIYRRNDSEKIIKKKFMMMEVCVFPQMETMKRIFSSFSMSYPFIERFNIETINALISQYSEESIFISGQHNWARHFSLSRERGFITTAMLRAPFQELAERLLFLSHVAKQSKRGSGNAIIARYLPLIPAVQEMDFQNTRSILASLRKLSVEQRQLLRSPMTSIFGCLPEEPLQRRHVSIALDNLAQLDLVGVRDHFGEFARLANDLAGCALFEGGAPSVLPGTAALAESLSDIGLVADLVDEDIALYSFARAAVEDGLGLNGAKLQLQHASRATEEST